ncbi:glycosyltransferase family 2 protein [Clostridium saccharoperbutylacetonicum]
MKIIITMAGLGSRFKNIGIDTPKYKIIANEKTLFEWSMLSLKDFFKEDFIFIIRKEILDLEFLRNTCEKLGISDFKVKVIEEETDGQATTAYLADEFTNDDEECVIYNIDTYVRPNEILRSQIKEEFDGFIPVIKAEGNRWSFVKVDDKGKVVDVAEKVPISNLATIGLYYFKKWKIYKEVYRVNKQAIAKVNKEVYIAPMYKYMINDEMNIGIKILDGDSVRILGTPEEIERFDSEYYKNNC